MRQALCRGERIPVAADVLADETARGFDSRANFAHRLARFGEARKRTLAMAKHIAASDLRLELQSERRELAECRQYLVFRSYTTRDAVRLHGLRSCRKHLLCPGCAIARGSRLLRSYIPKYEQIVSVGDGSVLAQMMTLTVKDGPDLAERFKHLVSSLREFFKRRHRMRGSEAERIRGAVYSVEAKRGAGSGLWHPHVHLFVVVDASAPVRLLELSAEWKSITGDSHVVDIHDVYGDPVEAFCEVFKYAIKFSDLSLDDNVAAYLVLRGRHLIGTFGVFFGVHVPGELVDELLDDESLPYLDVMFSYFGSLGYVHTGVVGSSRDRVEVSA